MKAGNSSNSALMMGVSGYTNKGVIVASIREPGDPARSLTYLRKSIVRMYSF
jgi:hypothetical protein